MAKLEVTDLRSKSPAELQEVLHGQLSQPHLLTAVRKDIARVKTLISEKAGS